MTFSLFPISSPEELALGGAPSGNGEPMSLKVIAVLYLLMVLLISQLPLVPHSTDARSDAAASA